MIEISLSGDDKVPAELDKLAGTLYKDVVDDAIHPYLDNVQDRARSNHRFESRTGNLERAIRVSKTQNGGSVYVDESIAPYARHVHDGHRSWSADNFLYDAYDESELDDMIDDMIDRELNK